ncbi:MAG: nitrogen fixation protein NifU [Gemmatimonadetes bacterium]|nr:nitrogen fixation protein NifU [Gemmatimonadota bacterium]
MSGSERADLMELYQSIILDHNRRPKNYGALEVATARRHDRNPACGDEIHLDLHVEDDVITDVKFTAEGCAVSRASASIMTQAVKGKSREEADALFVQFRELVTGKLNPTPDEVRKLGEIAAFSGVSRFPIRVKCASMAWHSLQAALRGDASAS